MRTALLIAVTLVVLYLLWREFFNGGASVSDFTVDNGSTDVSVGSEGTEDMATGTAATFGDKIAAWAKAIQQHEGWFPGSASYRNNNPGNLKYAGQKNALGADRRGFAIFPSATDGLAALESDLSAKAEKYPNLSILGIMTRYLGGDPMHPAITSQGNPFTYAQRVADALGVSVNDTLGSVFGGISNS